MYGRPELVICCGVRMESGFTFVTPGASSVN